MITQLHELAAQFRTMLQEKAARSINWGLSISAGFPHACCDDSSQLLAAYLADHGFPGALRVQGASGGANEELASHVWLLLDEIIVDITADQFEEYGLDPVICTSASNFHDSFSIEEELEPADFRLRFAADPSWKAKFQRAYDDLLAPSR